MTILVKPDQNPAFKNDGIMKGRYPCSCGFKWWQPCICSKRLKALMAYAAGYNKPMSLEYRKWCVDQIMDYAEPDKTIDTDLGKRYLWFVSKYENLSDQELAAKVMESWAAWWWNNDELVQAHRKKLSARPTT